MLVLQGQKLVADVDKRAKMVGKSSIQAYAGVRSLSRAVLVVQRLFRSLQLKSIHVLRCGDDVTLKL